MPAVVCESDSKHAYCVNSDAVKNRMRSMKHTCKSIGNESSFLCPHAAFKKLNFNSADFIKFENQKSHVMSVTCHDNNKHVFLNKTRAIKVNCVGGYKIFA